MGERPQELIKDKGEVVIDLSKFVPQSVEDQREVAVRAAFKGKSIEGKFVDVKISKALDSNESRRAIRDLIDAGGGKIAQIEVV